MSEEPDDLLPALFQPYRLTGREPQVLGWISKGKSNRDAAEIPGLSTRTVDKHLEGIAMPGVSVPHSRLIYGARLSLLMGVVPVPVAFLIGATLGIVAGDAGVRGRNGRDGASPFARRRNGRPLHRGRSVLHGP